MSRVSASTGPVYAARGACSRWSLPRRATKQTGQCVDKIAGSDFGRRRRRRPVGLRAGCPNQTHSGSAFAGALQRRSSLEWNDHAALLASCIASRTDGFAAMRIVEAGSNHVVDSTTLPAPILRVPGLGQSQTKGLTGD